MQIAVGYEFIWELPKPTPMLLTVHIHYSRASDLAVVDNLVTVPSVPVTGYRDLFGNRISRIVAPFGQFLLSSRAIVNDSGRPDPVCLDAIQHAVQDIPEETLLFLVGSRYCETDRLSEVAWSLFGGVRLGGAACRLSATSFIITSNLATSIPAQPKRPGKHTTSAPAYAGTLPIWR
jgi:hypothetical protein